MRFLAALLLSAACALGQRDGESLDALLGDPQLFSLTRDAFQQRTKRVFFRWNSNRRETARAIPIPQIQRRLTFAGLEVVEALVHFDDTRVKAASLSLYNRGDVGEIPKATFDGLLRDSIAALDAHLRQKSTARGKDAQNAVKADGYFWETNAARYELEYSFTKVVKTRDIPFRAEFIRLEILPPAKDAAKPAVTSSQNQKPRFDGASHIERDPAGGDVWLRDVPMVDQGEKGYCAVASAERVLRYYGASVDFNELAQIANTETDGGTSAGALLGALRKIGSRLKVKIREIENPSVRDWERLIVEYNRAAKRLRRRELHDEGGDILSLPKIYGLMEGGVLKEARTKNKAGLARFQRQIQSHIEEGIPLLWSVQLGIIAERGRTSQTSGGHMRLIIGYNAKRGEILFSDTWGAGHEKKRMKLGDAWTITSGVNTIEPLG